ncbi:MAG: phage terminase large subunit [Candidatus Neomarinimicrobiota bacterium]
MKIKYPIHYLPDLKPKRTGRKTLSIPEYVEKFFLTDEGQPFTFSGRDYLLPIYESDAKWLVLMSSRQAEKSTFLSKKILLHAIENKNSTQLFVTSQEKHKKDFIRRKIYRQFHLQPNYWESLLTGNSTKSVEEITFSNGASILFRAIGNSPDSVRGISASKIYFDEVQSIPYENILIALECAQGDPDTSSFIFAGTPLTVGNTMNRLFADTDQGEWCITCTYCGTINPPLNMSHVDLKKEYLPCAECGEALDRLNGKWIPQHPSSPKTGFRISRLMTPTMIWRNYRNGIHDNFESYSPDIFSNETMGLPYDVGKIPISEEELLQYCSEEDFIDIESPPKSLESTVQLMGVDWAYNTKDGGKSYIVLAVATMQFDHLKILFAKRFTGIDYDDPDKVLAEISKIIRSLHVEYVASDHGGGGHFENIRMKKMFSATVAVTEMQYVRALNQNVTHKGFGLYSIAKTPSINQAFSRIKGGYFRFPKKEVIKKYISDLQNVRIDYNEDTRSKHFRKSDAGPDDFLHVLNYLSILSDLARRSLPY